MLSSASLAKMSLYMSRALREDERGSKKKKLTVTREALIVFDGDGNALSVIYQMIFEILIT